VSATGVIRFRLAAPAVAAAALALCCNAIPAAARGPVELRPVNPQPHPAKLVPGLRVEYSYPPDAHTFVEAKTWPSLFVSRLCWCAKPVLSDEGVCQDEEFSEDATEAKLFRWTADPDKIIAARNRGSQTLESIP